MISSGKRINVLPADVPFSVWTNRRIELPLGPGILERERDGGLPIRAGCGHLPGDLRERAGGVAAGTILAAANRA